MEMLSTDAHGPVSNVLDVRNDGTPGLRDDMHAVQPESSADLPLNTGVDSRVNVNVVTDLESVLMVSAS